MRNLEECQAEVFRRSKKRIQKRDRLRKQMIASAPLVLCVFLLSVFVLPEWIAPRSGDSAAPEAVYGGMGQNYSQEISQETDCSVSEIRVSGGDISRIYTDSSDVTEISSLLYACTRGGADSNGTALGAMRGEKKEHADTVYESVVDSANTGYTLTLALDADKTEVYYLLDSTLTNLTTQQTHSLSLQQVNELKELVGILQP